MGAFHGLLLGLRFRLQLCILAQKAKNSGPSVLVELVLSALFLSRTASLLTQGFFFGKERSLCQPRKIR